MKPTPRLVRWMAEIEMYRPVIKYKPGKENGVPDALSRRVESAVVDKTLGLEPDYLYVTRTIADEDWPLYYHIDIPNDLADSMKQRLEREKDKFFVKDNRVWRHVKMGAKTGLDM
ncbi:hypothetical protein G6F38_013727 [Rhizopus arrhizus]|nr:hypothetical protein G6F38_013727 [Rhizopus arrhizus]